MSLAVPAAARFVAVTPEFERSICSGVAEKTTSSQKTGSESAPTRTLLLAEFPGIW